MQYHTWKSFMIMFNSNLSSIFKVKENIHDESDIFEVKSIGGGIFSLIKLYGSEHYLACDQDGNVTLVEDKHPENPSPQILFSFNKVGVVHDNWRIMAVFSVESASMDEAMDGFLNSSIVRLRDINCVTGRYLT